MLNNNKLLRKRNADFIGPFLFAFYILFSRISQKLSLPKKVILILCSLESIFMMRYLLYYLLFNCQATEKRVILTVEYLDAELTDLTD